MNKSLLKLITWAGIIGPTLFIATFTIEGWFRTGYKPLEMYVSELALGPRGIIQAVNFIIYGILFFLFALGTFFEFKKGKVSLLGPILLVTIGISIFAAGLFVMDPVTTFSSQMSWHGKLHSIAGAFIFGLWPISCFVFWKSFRGNFRQWTLIVGSVTAATATLMFIGPAKPQAPPNVFNQWIGLIQRISIFTYLSWQFTFALRLLKRK